MKEDKLNSSREQSQWSTSSDIESGVDHFHWNISSQRHAWRPPTDVYVTDQAVIVRVEVPGMKNGEFSITFEDHILSIQGIRPDQSESRAYHQMEIRFGEFRSDIQIHWAIATDQIAAEYQDGFLRVYLPLVKPKNIKIQE
jgi:HSP20 family protein